MSGELLDRKSSERIERPSLAKQRQPRKSSTKYFYMTELLFFLNGDPGGNRTRDKGFADPCLTTWRPDHRYVHSAALRTIIPATTETHHTKNLRTKHMLKVGF